MKGTHPRITLLGSNSGNNLGDAAIMSSIFESLTKELPNVEFYVPSTRPSFIDKNYGNKYNARGVNIMPWTLSLRMLGLPTFWCLWKSDAALICDGIIFGKKLFNPAFNFLITLIFVVPFARLVGCKMVCYSCGIGPFPSWISKVFARWVIDGSDLVMMRENDSRKLTEEIGVKKPVELTGDAAFINPVSSPERADELAKKLGIDFATPTLGVNVTRYLDTWLEQNERVSSPESFFQMLSEGIDLARSKAQTPFQVVLFSTHPMDEPFCRDVAARLGGKLVENSTLLSHDIQSLMRKCELFIGMRFHSVVLASAVETPVVGLIYAPKVRGYMRLLNCADYALELGKLTPEILGDKLSQAWNQRKELKARQKPILDELKAGATRAARLIRERYFPERAAPKAAATIMTRAANT